jgi:hypothetical protein
MFGPFSEGEAASGRSESPSDLVQGLVGLFRDDPYSPSLCGVLVMVNVLSHASIGSGTLVSYW